MTRLFAWLLLAGGLAFGLHRSWHYFDDPTRPDGNDGHVRLHFGRPWLMGRPLVEGHARQLYDRDVQRAVLSAHLPPGDVERLMVSFVGDGRRGGPLYPPTHALLFAPLSLLPPQASYRVAQVLNVVLAFL